MNSEFIIEDGILIKYTGNSPVVEIPHGVKSIKRGWTSNYIDTIIYPATFDFSSDYDGDKIPNLKKIVISEGTTKIGDNYFSFFRELETAVLPSSLQYIGDSAFYGCRKLVNIELPENLIYLGTRSFASCGIEKIDIPGSLKRVAPNAFEFCRHLTEVNFNEGIEQIEDNAFASTGVTKIIMPNSVIIIGKGAFKSCNHLKEVDIPNVYMIYDCAFAQSGLESFVAPPSLIFLEKHVFASCKNLRDVYLGNYLRHLKYSFSGCDNLKYINIFDMPFVKEFAFKDENELLEMLKTNQNLLSVEEVKDDMYSQDVEDAIDEEFVDEKDTRLYDFNRYLNKYPNYAKYFDSANEIMLKVFNDPDFKTTYTLYNFSSLCFLENIDFLYKCGITSNDEIVNIIKRNPLILNISLKNSLIANYNYLLKQKIIGDRNLSLLIFNYSFDGELNEENIYSVFEQIYVINGRTVDNTMSALLIEQNDLNLLELRDRITYIYIRNLVPSLSSSKLNQARDILKKDFIDTIKNKNRTELGLLNDGLYVTAMEKANLMAISINLYEKLVGIKEEWFDELCSVVNNNETSFSEFRDNLLSLNNIRYNVLSERERSNRLKNEIVGKLLYAYIVKVLEKDNSIQNAKKFKEKHSMYDIPFKEIFALASTSNGELYINEKAISIMLEIDPYSFDALRGTNLELSEQIIAKAHKSGYLFSKNERQEKGICDTPNIKNYVEHIANDIGIAKIPNEDRMDYLHRVKSYLHFYAQTADSSALFELGKAVDFYLRASHIDLLQDDENWVSTVKQIYDRDSGVPEESVIMYTCQETSRLAHSAIELNYRSVNINKDRMLCGRLRKSKDSKVKDCLGAYHKLIHFGLNTEYINYLLAMKNTTNYKRIITPDLVDLELSLDEKNQKLISQLRDNVECLELTVSDIDLFRSNFETLATAEPEVLEQARQCLEEYYIFYDTKKIMLEEMVNRVVRTLEPPTIDSFLTMSAEDKKKFFKEYGFIVEIQLDIDRKGNIKPTLVGYSKEFTTTMSVHIEDNLFNINERLNLVSPATLSHCAIGYDCLTLRDTSYNHTMTDLIAGSDFMVQTPGFYGSRIPMVQREFVRATNFQTYDMYDADYMKGRNI